MPTMRDVAEKAGVSVGTVSHVLNQTANVREETKKRVFQAIRTLKYRPNAAARSLVTKTTHVVGLVVTNISNPFYPEVVEGAEEVAAEAGYSLVIGHGGDQDQRLRQTVETFYDRGLDGIIGKFDHTIVDYLLGQHVPTVVFDTNVNNLPVDVVHIEYRTGMEDVVSHLLELGHRHIGFLAATVHWDPRNARLEAFQEIMDEYGLNGSVEYGGWTVEGGRRSMYALLDHPHPPTAVIASNDLMCLGAMETARECGYQVPKDLSIAGIDNIPTCRFVTPALTTLSLPRRELGVQAMKLLLQRLADPKLAGVQRQVTLQTELIVRESTAAAPQ